MANPEPILGYLKFKPSWKKKWWIMDGSVSCNWWPIQTSCKNFQLEKWGGQVLVSTSWGLYFASPFTKSSSATLARSSTKTTHLALFGATVNTGSISCVMVQSAATLKDFGEMKTFMRFFCNGALRFKLFRKWPKTTYWCIDIIRLFLQTVLKLLG